jgi:hypothetical protein
MHSGFHTWEHFSYKDPPQNARPGPPPLQLYPRLTHSAVVERALTVSQGAIGAKDVLSFINCARRTLSGARDRHIGSIRPC